MKQSLQLRLGQQLSMTPQLQQAIRLLQLSTLDLKQEIQQTLESNFMLEMDNIESDIQSSESNDDLNQTEITEKPIDLASESIPDELPTDSQWDDVFSNTPLANTKSASSEDFDILNITHASETLLSHLRWQLNLTHFTDQDRWIAEIIIDSIDNAGYLSISLDEIKQTLHQDNISIADIEIVRHRIQLFDPIGVASVNLQDCLLVQLKQLPIDTPFLRWAKQLVQKHFSLLSEQKEKQIIRRLDITQQQLRKINKLIKTLNPKPGLLYGKINTTYIEPDVYVFKQGEQWQVELNPEISPDLKINQQYAKLVKRADNSKDNQCIKDNLVNARWFIKSLEGRNSTLLMVAKKIVEVQRAYFDYGDEAMKPLVLKEVAEDLELHESTVSRITNQKYMHTPRGIIEFKYFFSSHISTATGGECSSTAIKALIKKLILAEKPQKPLSDDKLSSILKEQGIKVARRTVAKYREGMAIPSSSKRKRLN